MSETRKTDMTDYDLSADCQAFSDEIRALVGKYKLKMGFVWVMHPSISANGNNNCSVLNFGPKGSRPYLSKVISAIAHDLDLPSERNK